MTKIVTHTKTFEDHYPQAIAYRQAQHSIFWTPEEVDVGKDIQDIKVNLNETERDAILMVLKLFSHYEMHVQNFWDDICEMFPRPEIIGMAKTFAAVESGVHLPFYSNINRELGCHTEEFYSSYKVDNDLRDRMEDLEKWLDYDDIGRKLIAFAFVEGALLYSSFAFLKSFQANGRNLMPNLAAGISFSVRDESLHSEAAGWLFQQWCAERDTNPDHYLEQAHSYAQKVVDTESVIISKIFAGGTIEGVTEKQLVAFVKHRCDAVLKNMGVEPLFKVDYNPIADYFYENITGYSQHDFFAISGNQYSRTWDERGFTWNREAQ